MTGPTVPGTAVSGAERRLGVEYWLLVAAEDRTRARREWSRDGVTLLRCGGVFGAVGISAGLIHAAAGTDDPAAVDRFLIRALCGGPVFMDSEASRYYVLVGSLTGQREEFTRARDDVVFLGRDHQLEVPAVDAIRPGATRSYWCVEMGGPGDLADPDIVARLVQAGRFRMADGEGHWT